MFTELTKINTKGGKVNRKDKQYLQQLSTGVYCTLSEKLAAYDPEALEQMTILRYQAIIVLLCLWERAPGTSKYSPYLVTVVNDLMKKRELDQLVYKDGEYTAFFRSLPPQLFIDACDSFADKCNREELEVIYLIADEKLQPTNKETKEALGND
tara:strand:- start:214 stop:675 length:462 start_codon:yes stop_codon:yes gene_type:complete